MTSKLPPVNDKDLRTRLDGATVDSKKLEYGPGRLMLVFLLLKDVGLWTVVFQLSGFLLYVNCHLVWSP